MPCWFCVGSTAVTKPKPNCWATTEPATCSAEIASRAVRPSTAPITISWNSSVEHRPERLEIDAIGLLMRRQQDGGEHQRDREAHARGQVQFADARQQHDHGADAGEGQQESGGQRRQE